MKKRLYRYIRRHPNYLRAIQWLKRRRISKGRASLYSVVSVLINKLRDDEIIDRSNAVAFNFTLSIFPLIIFLFTLIPFFSNYIPNMEIDVMAFFQDVMPQGIYDSIAPTVSDIISNRRSGLLSFGFLSAIFFAGNGILSLMRAFNAIYRTREKRSYLRTRLVATAITFLLAGVLFVAIALIVIGQLALNWLESNPIIGSVISDSFDYYAIIVLRFIVVFLIFQIAISFIYYLGPSMKKKWHFFNWGSVIASLAAIAVSFGFAFYVTQFNTYNRLYGSIGTLIASMFWFYLLSLILLVGHEINASIDKAVNKDFSRRPFVN